MVSPDPVENKTAEVLEFPHEASRGIRGYYRELAGKLRRGEATLTKDETGGWETWKIVLSKPKRVVHVPCFIRPSWKRFCK